MKTAVIRARIPESLKQDFETAAAAHGWNLSQAIRQLMNQYVAQEQEMDKRHQETIEALEDIETGRVLEGSTVMDWLENWGESDEQEPPK